MNEPLQKAIVDFNLATIALKQAERALNVPVQAILAANPTSDDLHELLEQLPTSYRGVRRIYDTLSLRNE